MAKLYYFNGRGKAEVIRMTLAAAGIPFEEELLSTREDFLKLMAEGKLLYGQVPLLEMDDKLIVQANAIIHYVSRKAGLLGTSLDQEVLIHQYYEGGRDFISPMWPLCYLPEQQVIDGRMKRAIAKYFPIFEKVAADNGTGFLVGSSLTVADISVLECLLVCVEYLGMDVLADFPALQKFYRVVSSVDRVASYLAGPQRKPKNDERYVTEVCRALGLERHVMIAKHFGTE